MAEVLWTPSPDRVRRSELVTYAAKLVERGEAVDPDDYESIWRWSVADVGRFWRSVADFYCVEEIGPDAVAFEGAEMPGVDWFPGVELSFPHYALARQDGTAALVYGSETAELRALSSRELADLVARAAAGFRALGVTAGDRVVGMLPNGPEAVIAFLGAASLGAVWSCCPPDFGARSIVDRFAQIEPKVLVAVDGYTYAGRPFDRRSVVEEIRAALPSLEHTVQVPYLDRGWAPLAGHALSWDELLTAEPLDHPVPVPFGHPLWILFSSGTTGLPKPIVHSHGGMLLEHLKGYGLQLDVGPTDRVLWVGSTGWAVWNLMVSALTVGASIVLYDGNPAYPGVGRLWDLVAESNATVLGAGAALFHASMKAGRSPGDEVDLSRLRTIASTGSPLSDDAFHWMYRAVSPDVQLASMSGGTDVCSAFVGPCPLLPVRVGEMQCRWLGADVHAFDEAGAEVVDAVGELVVTSPMPAMPVSFWADPDGARYRESYFDTYPGVWRHGDWIRVGADGSCAIYGRSDSTLNRSGVRMGTSDFYAIVERIPGVAGSLVIDTSGLGGEGELIAFVSLDEGQCLDDDLVALVRRELRDGLSPRHVPDRIVQVTDIPVTLTGKKTEIPVKRILGGTAVDDAVSLDSLANPEAIAQFVTIGSTLRGR